jgi:hypothetical protein
MWSTGLGEFVTQSEIYNRNYETCCSEHWFLSFGVMLAIWLIAMVFAVISIVALWKIFTKAGQPGWAAIIPIYNYYIMLKIAGRPGWWLLLYFIPLVQIIVSAIVAMDIAQAFGRSKTFGVVALWLFSIIGYLILGFGNDTYKGAPNQPTAQ